MAMNPTPPEPHERIWTTVYLDGDTECFEIRTLPDADSKGLSILYHKEYTTGTAVGDFLDTDLSVWDQLASKLQEHLNQINQGRFIKKGFNMVFYCTLYWLDQSGFFAPFAAALERLHIDYKAMRTLTLDECNSMMAYYRELQEHLRMLCEQVYDADESEDVALRYFVKQQEEGLTEFPPFTFDSLSYLAMNKGVGGLFPYDEFLEEEERRDFEAIITEVLETEDARAFSEFLICRYLQENIHLRKCKYCGRYFNTHCRSKLEYCDRLIENSSKTCREMGSLRLYEKRKMEDPAVREYKRAYKTHNARIRYGLMTREEFTQWSVEARAKRDLCSAGELPLEEFVDWLNSDRPPARSPRSSDGLMDNSD